MHPEMAETLERLRDAGTLPASSATHLLRIARGQLVSIHTELRVAFYAGVLILMAGIGLLLRQELHRLGPVAVAIGLAIGAAMCFWWVDRHAGPFTWASSPSPHLAFDYILLLATLLAVSDLGYVEAQFTPLGPSWPWHLLIVALAAATIAVRYDSRVVFSLALSSFAAWRGITISLDPGRLWRFHHLPESLRANALGCGLSFVLLGLALVRLRRKPHFEPVAVTLGVLLGLGAFVSGIDSRSDAGLAWTIVTLLASSALLLWSWNARRFVLLAMGLAGTYVAMTGLFFRSRPGDKLAAAWLLFTSAGLVLCVILMRRRLKEDA